MTDLDPEFDKRIDERAHERFTAQDWMNLTSLAGALLALVGLAYLYSLIPAGM